jgi:hypothetical protein
MIENPDKIKKINLQNNYSKLLAYLGTTLVSFFTLFQIAESETTSWIITHLISITVFVVIVVLLYACYGTFDDIIKFENELGLSEYIGPSKIFSMRVNKDSTDRKISWVLQIGCIYFCALSFFLLLHIIGYV